MSELQFPKDPIVGQEYDFAPYKYYWDGIKWKTKGIGYNPVNDLRDELEPRISNNESKVFEALKRSYADAGLNLVEGNFEEGGELLVASDVMLTAAGIGYSWGGPEFPHNVAPGTDPAAVGSGYAPRTDVTLRAGLASEGGSELVGHQSTGTGAVATNVQSKLREIFSLNDFIPHGVNTETTDCSPYMQAALNAGGGGVFIPPGRYRMATQLALVNTAFYDGKPGRTIYGHNAQIIVDTTVPLFSSNKVEAPTGYTSKWKFRDISFFSSTAGAKLFDMDRIYNSIFSHCVFEGITSVFYSRVDREGNPDYPYGYIQSAYINNNHFASCTKVVDAKRAFNLAVSHNYFEACDNCVTVDGTGDPAGNQIRITDNVMEGGAGTPIILGSVFGGVITGNYFEANFGATTCEINLAVPGAAFHRGLTVIGNSFQPTATQRADTNFYSIRINKTISDGRGPVILGNTTTGPRLLTGTDKNSFVTGNYEANSTQILNSFPIPQQTNISISGTSEIVNNRATAFDGINTWSVININNIARSSVYEIDGFLNLYNIGGTLLGRTCVSFKFWVQVDDKSVYTAGLIGEAKIYEMTGARDSSGNPLYSDYWGSVTPMFSFSGSTLTIKFNTFTNYSMPGAGGIYSLGPDLVVRSMTGTGNYTRVQISMP